MKSSIGTITVICGSMFAGKTEELIRRARRALYAKQKVQVFKPAIDSRYDEAMVVTHMGVRHDAVAIGSVSELIAKVDKDTNFVGIEEVQFFSSEIIPFLVKLADKGVDVVVAGLDQDFRRLPFGPVPELMAIADDVVKLHAICMNCGAIASHTYRSIDGKPAHVDDPLILIGATESYEARCRRCYKIRGSR